MRTARFVRRGGNGRKRPARKDRKAGQDARGEKDSDVYKRAGVDRKLFSKIRSDANYTPKKRTAILFAFALSLNEDQARDLLARAGYSLSDADTTDIIVQYFLQTDNHDLSELDEVLVRFGERPVYSE